MYTYSNLVNGHWRNEATSYLETWNPARPREVVGRYALASDELLQAALAAAATAQAAWRALPMPHRLEHLAKFIASVECRAGELAQAIVLEQGKPRQEALNEISKACSEGRYMLGHAMAAAGEHSMPAFRPGVRNAIQRRPRGVIAAITPWNFPVMTPMRKLIPALAFGNAVLLKPSEFTPAAACLLADIGQAHLPPGLLQLLHLLPDMADRLVRAAGVHGVAFTGSVATGRKIRRATADNLAETALELGGKNAAVIHDTPDLCACLDQIAEAAFMTSGQRCTAISRVLVQRDHLAATLEGLSQRAQARRPGYGMAEGTRLGPITHPAQLAHIERLVKDALAQGCKAHVGGSRIEVDGCTDGLFFAPTVIECLDARLTIAREEVFGPVIVVQPYDTADEAMQQLNGVEYGLSASLFSTDLRLVERFVKQCETGMIHVNHGTIPDSHMPFGGIKASGVGAYSVGPSAAHFYTTEHAVYVGV